MIEINNLTKRKLILTADESTWPQNFKDPVFFLGEWCKIYSRKEQWRRLDAKVAPYHWDDRQKLFKDYIYLQKLYEKVLLDLSNKLNHIHSVNYSLRYWRILVGPWLYVFISILYDRWFMLKQTIDNEEITECKIIKRDLMSVVPNDMKHFTNLCTDDDWNEAIYGQLLELYWYDVVKIKKIQKLFNNNIHKNDKRENVMTTFKTHIINSIIQLFNKLFSKNNSYFFISTYLDFKTDFKLQMRLGQLPKLWQRLPAPIIKPDSQQRQWRLDGKSKDTLFEDVVRRFIPSHIPSTYLEGYKELEKVTIQTGWPKRPKGILTSNAYNSDDVFKKWAAGKIETGTNLIIGQHGGHYGIGGFNFDELHEISIADKYLSWGWFDNLIPKILPVGNLKFYNKKVSYDSNGSALMVQRCHSRYSSRIFAAPLSSQFLDYLEDQKKFLEILPYKLRKQVLLRLYPIDYGLDQKSRWKDNMPEVEIETGEQNILKLIKKSRLYISTYNATTYLESLYWNVPTIIFWDPKHWELRENAKPYFELLKSVGIFHNSPKSAAQQMIKIWEDVDTWWNSKEIQDVRHKFCEQYTRDNDSLIRDIEKILVS